MKFDGDQVLALDRIYGGRNVFVTGSAGTGKSSVTVEAIRTNIGWDGMFVCATTGVAAINLRDKLAAQFGEHVNTSTLYRWAGIGLGPQEGDDWDEFIKFMRSRTGNWLKTVDRINQTRMLIIDEISMMPGKTLAFIDYLCKFVNEDPRPFGGIQIVAVGDFMQLPPVSKGGSYDWAFASRAWQEAEFEGISLRTIHRQDEPEFVSVLNQFRAGVIRPDSMRMLMGRVAMFPRASVLRLMTHNTQVDKWNAMMLNTCEGEEVRYTAEIVGTDLEKKALLSAMTTPAVLTLRRGARVMITGNLTSDDGTLLAANGEMAVVEDWGRCPRNGGNIVFVVLDSGRCIGVQSKAWELDPRTTDAYFSQIPLRLAWATTIHKSQGLTLDEAMLDIRSAREPGQAYVAVSRVRSLAGLHLKDAFKGVAFSPEARDYHRQIERQ